MTQSKRITQLLNMIPANRILLETDGPYVKAAGRAARPEDLPDVVRTLARVWGMPAGSAADRIRNNYGALIDRAGPLPDP